MRMCVTFFVFVLCGIWAGSAASMHNPLLKGFHCADVKVKKLRNPIGVCVRTAATCNRMRTKQKGAGHEVSVCRARDEAVCFHIAYPDSQQTNERCYTTISTCKIQRKGTKETEKGVVVGECHKSM